MADSIWDISVRDMAGEIVPLGRYRGAVLLVVNVASRCGYTPQYRGLETLWRRYRDSGLIVLGFPCNQFGGQEPESEPAIAAFCSTSYDVTFPMFAKVEVNGANTHPLFRLLKSERPGVFGTEAIKWNFTKFLVGRHGRVLARYGSQRTPESIESEIVAALG